MEWIKQLWTNFAPLLLSERFLWWAGGLSVFLLLLSSVAVPLVLIWLPADYFTAERRHSARFSDRHPALRYSALLIKNLLGLILVLAGIAMLVLPGQGLLSILVGLLLLDFPGKYHLERRLVSQPRILSAANWLRRKARRPDLVVPCIDQ